MAGLLLATYAKPSFAFTDTAEEARGRAIDGLATVVDSDNKFTLVIDVGACIGCRRCMWACKEENNIPDTISPLWIEVFELNTTVSMTGHPSAEDLKEGVTTSYTESPLEGKWYLPVQCYHCDNPPCVKVCPTGATFKDKDGLVLINYERCIGCRTCVVACPYSARRFNWFEPEVSPDDINPLVPVRPVGVVEKCTFCVHRTRLGKLPRCVEVCPVRARHFGNINDPESEVSKILKSNPSFRLLEEVNTGPNIWYITRGKKWTNPQ
jgi:molybdopterin-containing oxidoreductase family iron-sulfur binding subunit